MPRREAQERDNFGHTANLALRAIDNFSVLLSSCSSIRFLQSKVPRNKELAHSSCGQRYYLLVHSYMQIQNKTSLFFFRFY